MPGRHSQYDERTRPTRVVTKRKLNIIQGKLEEVSLGFGEINKTYAEQHPEIGELTRNCVEMVAILEAAVANMLEII